MGLIAGSQGSERPLAVRMPADVYAQRERGVTPKPKFASCFPHKTYLQIATRYCVRSFRRRRPGLHRRVRKKGRRPIRSEAPPVPPVPPLASPLLARGLHMPGSAWFIRTAGSTSRKKKRLSRAFCWRPGVLRVRARNAYVEKTGPTTVPACRIPVD